MKMLERVAEWYLERRGRMVLPRVWNGIVLAGPQSVAVLEQQHGDIGDIWRVALPPQNACRYVAQCGAVIEWPEATA